MQITKRLLLIATVVTSCAVPTFAQPKAQAEVAPLPENTRKANRQKNLAFKQENATKRDQKMIEEFETMFGRKLTDAQKEQLEKAAEARAEAVRVAQENYTQEFLKVTGVTEKELREKRREARQKDKAAAPDANAANADAKNGRPRRQGKKAHPGNLPDGTPADAPQPAVMND